MGVGIKKEEINVQCHFTHKSYFGCDTPINDKPWVFYIFLLYLLLERKKIK